MLRLLSFALFPRLSPWQPWHRSKQSMRTGPDQGQIGPLLRRGFFCRERFARIFLSCPTPVLSGRISLQPITKLPSFLLKYFAVVLNYLAAKRMDSARRSARVLASSCSQHSRRAAHSSRRSKRGDYSAIIAFLPKSRHLSLVPTLSG